LSGLAYLAIAIVAEVIGTAALKASDGFSRTLPSIVTVIGYSIAFYGLSQAIKTIPVGIAYGIWSAVGIVLITAIGWVAFKQRLDAAALVGMALIVGGVVVIQLFSSAAAR
jgi:multidrug transporter EmrE-like cation transporter